MITLSNGNKIPAKGFGTWKAEENAVGEAVKTAIDTGYRHIDCAKAYGNEKEIGNALGEIFDSGKIKREEVFITSKLWNSDHNPENVLSACEKTLSDLQIDYIDLYLIHWGLPFDPNAEGELDKNGIVKLEKVPLYKTWEAMEVLVEKKLVRSIGVSNFTTPMITDLLNYANIAPVMNQVEIHPYNTQEELVEFCHKKDIAVTAYSPLGSHGEKSVRPISDENIIKIAQSYGKTPAQIILRWVIQRNIIALAKSTNPARIKENFGLDDFELNSDDMNRINGLNKNYRFVDPINFWGLPYFG